MRRLIALLTTLAATVAGTALATAPADAAPGGLDVGLTSFKHIVVDAAHSHIFLSQGTDTVVVTNLAGASVTSLTGLSGADGMALDPTGTTLWVALSTGDAIAAVDTTTLLTTATYPTGTTTCPTSVAVAAGAVWFGKGCGTAGIDGLDPLTGVIHAGSTASTGDILTASGSTLFAAGTGATATLHAFTATGGATASLTDGTPRATGSYAHDLAVGGTSVVQASSSPTRLQAFSTSSLSPAGSYPTGAATNAVALSSGGLVAGGTTATTGIDVWLFHSGSTSVYRTYSLGRLKNAGLAFGAGTTLYAVSDVGSGALRLFVIDTDTPTRTASTTRIATDRTTYAYGATAKVRVRLSARSTNRRVTVYKTVNGTRSKVKTASVPVGGTLTVPVKVTEKTVFVARYAGDNVSAPSSARTTVKVHAKVVQVLLGAAARRGNHYVFAAGHTIGYVAHVYPNHKGECLYLASQYKTGGSFTPGATSACQKLKSTSRVFVPLRTDASLKGVTLRFRGTFRGDARNLAATGPWLYVTFA